MISAGVSSSRRMAGDSPTPIKPIATPATRHSAMVVCTPSWTPFSSLAPKNCAMTTPAPVPRPVNSPTIRLTMGVLAPTAARALGPM